MAILLVIGFAAKYFGQKAVSTTASQNKIANDTKVDLGGFDWAKSKSTLVLAFSTRCGFCIDSSGFYKRLAERRAGSTDVRFIVVGSQPIEEVRNFFQEHNIVKVDEFVQAPLSDINVTGTPTLLLIGSDGLVKDSWVGKLPAEAESELVSRVF